MPPPWHFTTFLDLLDHWQSLAAGLVAVFAAIIAIGGTELFARLKERRERKALLLSLAAEVRMYLDLFIRKRAMLLRQDAWGASGMRTSELKTLAELPSPIVFSASADRIGLFGPRMAASLTEFYATLEALNFSVRVATADPGSFDGMKELDRRLEQVKELADLLEKAGRHALPLLDKLPREEVDAALKAAIERPEASG